MTEIFHDYPHRFPQTRAVATQFVAQMRALNQQGARARLATVVDTEYHTTAGYILAQMNSAVVQVYGVPYGSAVAGMQLYCRPFGGIASNYSFYFVNYAPNLSSLGSSGAILYQNSVTTSGVVIAQTSSGGIPTVSSLASASGYYWHCFFYIPTLPSSRVTLFSMSNSGATNIVTLEYWPTGQLAFRTISSNHGNVTTAPIAPHAVHWVQLQLGSTVNMLVDGVAAYTGTSTPSDAWVFSGGAATYTLTALSNADGSGLVPLGTWISKLGFGASYTSGAPVLLSTAIPAAADDSAIPQLRSSSTLQTQMLYLCTDASGTTALTNSSSISASTLNLVAPYAQLASLGPY